MKIRKIGKQTSGCIQAAGEIILDLLYPPVCAICGQILKHPRQRVCEKCRRALPVIRDPYCLKCGKPLPDETMEYCEDCSTRRHLFQRGRCCFRYDGDFRESVLRMKFHDRRDQIDFYAEAMAVYGKEFLQEVQPAVILPVPMHKRKQKERGYDQCRILAQKLSARTGIPAVCDAVVRNRYTLPQKGLSLHERQKNLMNAFEVVKPERLKEPVLLVDDIYTSGATMDALSQTLLRCGIHEIYFLALCTGADTL